MPIGGPDRTPIDSVISISVAGAPASTELRLDKCTFCIG